VSPLPALSKVSIRSQVILLGTVVVVLLVAVLVASFAALHYTRWAVLRDEQRNLSKTTTDLAKEYAGRAQFESQNNMQAPLEDPSSAASREILGLLSRLVLQGAEDVKAGFYSSKDDTLAAYEVSATAQSTLPDQGNAPSERNAILGVAREAASTREHTAQVLPLDNEIVIIDAVPLVAHGTTVGSAWTMKELPTLPGANRLRAYLTLVGLGAATLACVILTFLVVRKLQRGVRKLETGLQSLEQDLGSHVDASRELAEVQRIAQAINRLGTALSDKIQSEKRIEERLRHTERLAALGRLVAGVAHEVRNPLATIRLRLQLCQQLTHDPDVQESCEVALEEIVRLNGMVGRLLNFSQPVQLQREPMDLRQLLDQRVRSFSDTMRQHRVRLVTNFSNSNSLSDVDQGRMTQVFDNIIQNAIEAMADTGGTLCVSVTPDLKPNGKDRAVCVEFSDTGKGISESQLLQIFDPFFTTKATGTGLGLSICHELVRAHAGEIHVASAEGHGTTVRLTLPAHREEQSAIPA
jgi:signal transduction histidine kinase